MRRCYAASAPASLTSYPRADVRGASVTTRPIGTEQSGLGVEAMSVRRYDAQIPHFVRTNPPTCVHKSPDLCAQIPRLVHRAPRTGKLAPLHRQTLRLCRDDGPGFARDEFMGQLDVVLRSTI